MVLTSLPAAALVATLTWAAPQQDTTVYTVTNHGRDAGAMTVVERPDQVDVRYAHVDRNRGVWLWGEYRLDRDGRVTGVRAGPTSRDGVREEVEEGLELPGGEVGFLTTSRLLTPYEISRAATVLLGRPDGEWVSGEGDTLRAKVVARHVAGDPHAPGILRLVMVDLGGPWPSGVWLQEDGTLYANEAGWFITHRQGAEAHLPALRAAEVAYREARAEEIARSLDTAPAGDLVLVNGNVFDSETGEVRPGMTVVVRGERIAAVGPEGSVEVPSGAQVIDASGMTILPGMWDMHSHSVVPSQTMGAPIQLANGLTTVRDLAADLDVAGSLRARAESHDIVSPRQVLAGFIEGPGAWAGPSSILASTEAEARQHVAMYDALGYEQIKLYNLIHPDLVPTIAEEARARGLRLSGHIPRGMSVQAAVELGYDEVNHAAFLFSTFFPDSLWFPTMRPYSGVAAVVAPNVDVDGDDMSELLTFLAERGTVLDGTFNIWMGGDSYFDDEAEPNPVAQAYGRLLRRAWEEGVTLVPGTDNVTGATYRTELLMYEAVGIPAPEVLTMATLTSARVMGHDDELGRVAPGMIADLLVVDGNPAERIADLEHIHRVIKGGRVYDPEAIRAAVRAVRSRL